MDLNYDLGAHAAFKSTSPLFKQPLDAAYGPKFRHLYVLTYITGGKGYYEVNEKKYELGKGDSFLIYPGTKVHYHPDLNDKWEYMRVYFNGNEVKEFLEHTVFTQNSPVVYALNNPNNIYDLFNELCSYFEGQRNIPYIIKKLNRKAYLYRLLSEYIRIYPNTAQKELTFSDRIINYIYKKYPDPSFTVESLEKHFNLSHTSLYRYFKENFNTTPKHYINSLRISKAADLLYDTSLQIKDVSISVGFKDPLYFSKVFKKETGFAPSEYYEKYVVYALPFKVQEDEAEQEKKTEN